MRPLRVVRQDPGLLEHARRRAEHLPLVEIESWCVFVGHPRSGHSLVGSLIDAQPDAIVTHELDLLGLVQSGHDDPRLLAAACEERAAWFRQRDGRWGEHEYLVEGGWQGRVRRRRPVGDRKGGRTTLRLRRDPTLLDRLARIIEVPLWVVHVARHHLDNIATMVARRGTTVDQGIDDVLERARTVQCLRERHPAEWWIEVDQPSFCRESTEMLDAIVQRLLGAPDASVAAASAALVDPEPRRSRDRVDWSSEQVERIRAGVEALDAYARIRVEEDWTT